MKNQAYQVTIVLEGNVRLHCKLMNIETEWRGNLLTKFTWDNCEGGEGALMYIDKAQVIAIMVGGPVPEKVKK